MPKCDLCKKNPARYTMICPCIDMGNPEIKKSISNFTVRKSNSEIMFINEHSNIKKTRSDIFQSNSFEYPKIVKEKLCIQCYHMRQNNIIFMEKTLI